ncbi:DUF3238 domain-containing protein [Sporosarcina sp. ANT_H38]|uniref:DUF3238 domain-containing protein n=1 Tax=Sporosarcina sp. ANT_H38 TaxID=2597358 RepID=UPI0011F39055|nr:DUF3238 domain-containing protein [Sporosarcina sp. ANT_H38]KAA0948673.1 DUF3238 domain-containing protein [Sporosarcina sp. ANT_H38]
MKKSFEIQTVLHKADLIYFTWNDVGGTYNVYKDGHHLYEGTVSEFSDGDFKHAKLYNYVIERVEEGIVVEVIALQTSAFAEQKNKESPLQSLVMTTIVAKTQIALSWEEIKDVVEYDVYRNGKHLATVVDNRYIDRDFSLDEIYTYTIESKRSLAKSGERFNVFQSVVSTIFGMLNPVSSKEAATIERFSVTKAIAKPKELLKPVQDRVRPPNVDRWAFRYMTFLKDDWVLNPNILSRNRYFKGDDRGFDSNGASYRTRVDVELAYDLERSPLTFTRDVGQSLVCDTLKRFRKQATASHDGITLKRTNHGKEEAGFHLMHAVGNPLTTAPDINYEVRAVMRRDGTFDMGGYHDQAPHHEIYLMRGDVNDWVSIHQAESKGLAWMSEVIAWQYWRISNFE